MTDESTTEDFAEAWVPEPGDVLSGTVAGVTLSADMGYGPYPILSVSTSTGERSVHAFHQVLRSELARRRPRVGDEIEITYLGKRQPKSGNGNAFHVYRVKGGQEPEFNWDSELPESERQGESDVPIASSTVGVQTDEQVREAREAVKAEAEKSFGSDVPF